MAQGKGGRINLANIVGVLKYLFPDCFKGEFTRMAEIYRCAWNSDLFSKDWRDLRAVHEYNENACVEVLIDKFGAIKIDLRFIGQIIVTIHMDVNGKSQVIWTDRRFIVSLRQHGSLVAAFVDLIRDVETAGGFTFTNRPSDLEEVMKKYA